MEEVALLKDFAVIMVVAGAVALLFRKLRQPPVLGYLIAGLIVSPYTLSFSPIADVHTVKLLADLGLVLLLFGLGLEFSWSKIRQIGVVVLIIGVIEILTMIGVGYGLGRLLGWSRIDALFLGAALHISSTVIIMKILRDLGRLQLLSSKIVMGILVVEDFAAVVIITLLSGIATTGAADIGSIGSLLLKLGIFVAASLGFGALIVPRIMSFTHQFRSKELSLITSLGLCFALAVLSKYLGLSVAAGAFLMGALVGDTRHSEEVTEVVSPVRDMFAALFFVAIGMLINIGEFSHFIVPALIVSIVFILGKILINTLATFMVGYNGTTAIQVGMGKAQMGEFSLAIAKTGVDSGVVVAPLYPVVATATALTSFVAPYIIRSADSVAEFLSRTSPRLLKEYVLGLGDWLQALRKTSSRESELGRRIRGTIRAILIDFIIIVAIIGVGTIVLQFAEGMARYVHIGAEIIAAILGMVILVVCTPPTVFLWRNVRLLIDDAVRHVLIRRTTARVWNQEALRLVLRDSILTIFTVLILLWLIPFVSRLLFFGSLALTIPIILLAIVLYVTLMSVRHIHTQLRRTFTQVVFGEEHLAPIETAAPEGNRQSGVGRSFRKIKAFVGRLTRLI